MRELLVAKLKKARQNYIVIYTTNHTQARTLALHCAGRECMEFRLKLHNLDVGNE
ncbi:hypothetical protein [Sulfurimonas sp.]|uniref:hypothetical protein n=1 Tax=Sulfurimonas sp. TaxID=2022749 RepID=UPI002B485E92|nr:hypothetical protein [Sulfurimonas sp.]